MIVIFKNFVSYILLGDFVSKELFKSFVKLHPELADAVMSDKTTWQKLYELFDMYGENSSVWDKYITKSISLTKSDTSFSELISMIKKVDLESVQKGVNSLQKTIGLLQDIGIGTVTKEKTYEPRPLYRHFED